MGVGEYDLPRVSRGGVFRGGVYGLEVGVNFTLEGDLDGDLFFFVCGEIGGVPYLFLGDLDLEFDLRCVLSLLCGDLDLDLVLGGVRFLFCCGDLDLDLDLERFVLDLGGDWFLGRLLVGIRGGIL